MFFRTNEHKLVNPFNRSTGKSYGAVLGIFGMLLIANSWAKPQLMDKVVALVNDGVILDSELVVRMADIQQQIAAQNSTPPPLETLRQQVLERLITESIQLQMGIQMGVRIDDNRLNETMGNIARQNGLTLKQFREQLEAEGITYQKLREQIYRDLVINQVRKARVGQRVQVSDQDVTNFLKSNAGRTQLAADYRLGHILLPVSERANNEAIEAAAQLANATHAQLVKEGVDFKELARTISAGRNALEGGDLGWRGAAQLPTLFADKVIEMEKGDVALPIRSSSGFHIITVLDKRGGSELFVSQTQVRHILVKPNEIRSESDSHQLIKEIHNKITNGGDFAELAKTYSDDPGSARSGGDLNWVSPKSMVPAFEEIMNKTELQGVSEPFKTEFGWHVLEVLSRRNQDMSEEFRNSQAKNFIYKRKFDEELQVWIREIRDEAFVEIKQI